MKANQGQLLRGRPIRVVLKNPIKKASDETVKDLQKQLESTQREQRMINLEKEREHLKQKHEEKQMAKLQKQLKHQQGIIYLHNSFLDFF
jgi:hypothetical protein